MSLNLYDCFIVITLIFSRIIILFNIDNQVLIFIQLIIIMVMPGFILIINLFNDVKIHEILPISITLSLVVNIILSLILSGFKYLLYPEIINYGYFILFFLLFIVNKLYIRDNNRTINISIKNIYKIFIFIIPSCFSFLLFDDILKNTFYLGFDPFINKPLIDSIIYNKYTLFQFLSNKSIVFSGFYYFCTLIHVYTNVSIHLITKYGGIFSLSLIMTLMFLIVYKINFKKISIIVPFMFIINPFVVDRFFMTIRENLSLVCFTLLTYFLILSSKQKNKNVILISLINSSIIVTHPLTAIYSTSTIIIMFLYRKQYKKLINIFSLMLVLLLPIIYILSMWATWVVRAQISILINSQTIPTPFWLSEQSILLGWGREILVRDFSMMVLLLLPISLYLIIKKTNKTYYNVLELIIPLILTTFLLFLLYKLGFHFTSSRLNVWISFIISCLSGIGLIELLEVIVRPLPAIRLLFKKREIFLRKDIIRKIIIVIVLTPIVLFNSMFVLNIGKWSPYSSQQVDGAMWLKNGTDDEFSIIIPSYGKGLNDITLLEFVGIKNSVSSNDVDFLVEIMTSESYENLIYSIKNKYPHMINAYYFMSIRWIRHYESMYDFQLLTILNENCELIYNKKAIIYKIF